jgi:hypothetical protein
VPRSSRVLPLLVLTSLGAVAAVLLLAAEVRDKRRVAGEFAMAAALCVPLGQCLLEGLWPGLCWRAPTSTRRGVNGRFLVTITGLIAMFAALLCAVWYAGTGDPAAPLLCGGLAVASGVLWRTRGLRP